MKKLDGELFFARGAVRTGGAQIPGVKVLPVELKDGRELALVLQGTMNTNDVVICVLTPTKLGRARITDVPGLLGGFIP